jgi:hypothetical protein
MTNDPGSGSYGEPSDAGGSYGSSGGSSGSYGSGGGTYGGTPARRGARRSLLGWLPCF